MQTKLIRGGKNNFETRISLSACYVNRYDQDYSIRVVGKDFGFENNILSIPL